VRTICCHSVDLWLVDLGLPRISNVYLKMLCSAHVHTCVCVCVCVCVDDQFSVDSEGKRVLCAFL